jgi:hypothetical protein
MWRTHLDVPKPDVILDSSYVALAVRRISRSPHYPFLHRRACEEICSVLHDQNGPGYAENPQPAMWESSSTSEIGLCIWFSRDGHRGLGCSLLVSKESGRRSPLCPSNSQSNCSSYARDQQSYVDSLARAEPDPRSGHRDAGGKTGTA